MDNGKPLSLRGKPTKHVQFSIANFHCQIVEKDQASLPMPCVTTGAETRRFSPCPKQLLPDTKRPKYNRCQKVGGHGTHEKRTV